MKSKKKLKNTPFINLFSPSLLIHSIEKKFLEITYGASVEIVLTLISSKYKGNYTILEHFNKRIICVNT